MNKRRIMLCISLVLLCTLCIAMLSSCAVNVSTEGAREYLEEKIIPVIAGVTTALIAFFASLKSIIKTLKELRGARDELKSSQREIERTNARELGQVKQKYDEIAVSVKQITTQGQEISEISRSVKLLREQIARLSEIASLGFSKDCELVSSGKGKKIVALCEQNRVTEAQNEA